MGSPAGRTRRSSSTRTPRPAGASSGTSRPARSRQASRSRRAGSSPEHRRASTGRRSRSACASRSRRFGEQALTLTRRVPRCRRARRSEAVRSASATRRRWRRAGALRRMRLRSRAGRSPRARARREDRDRHRDAQARQGPSRYVHRDRCRRTATETARDLPRRAAAQDHDDPSPDGDGRLVLPGAAPDGRRGSRRGAGRPSPGEAPRGIRLDPATGVLSGTPEPGMYGCTAEVRDRLDARLDKAPQAQSAGLTSNPRARATISPCPRRSTSPTRTRQTGSSRATRSRCSSASRSTSRCRCRRHSRAPRS